MADDVRELLLSTTADADPSTPLSAPDLRLLIDHLRHRSDHLHASALSFAASNREPLASALLRAASSAASSASLQSSLQSALSPLSSSPDLSDLRSLSDRLVAARRELRERQEHLAAASSVASLSARLRAARASANPLDAAAAAAELKPLLVNPEGSGSGGDEPVVFGLLRGEWEQLVDELQVGLSKNVEECVEFAPDGGKVAVRAGPSGSSSGTPGVELRVALQALEIIDSLDYGMAKVADLMIKHVFVPAISNISVTVSVEVLEKSGSTYPASVLNIVPSEELQGYKDGSVLYSRIIDVIKFARKFICVENITWTQSFAKLTWSRISDLVITHFLSEAVPDEASKLIGFQDVIRSTTEFENTLRGMMFISPDRKDGKLTQFVDDVEVHFAVRKRNEILVKARYILVQYDYKNPLCLLLQASDDHGDSVVDLLFQPEKCFISKSALQLMKLVHGALKDACLSSARVAKEFCYAARDALLLYKAIVPVQLEKQLNSISPVAAIIHNDFYHLSQEILGLAFEYRADFPSGQQKLVVFVDLAPIFSQMADGILRRQIQLAAANLSEAIDGADGFQNTHQSQHCESAKFSIEQVVFILEKIHIMWESVLPRSIYRRSMFHVLGPVFSRITKDMLLIDDMAAEETLQLQGLIHLALENLSSLFLSLVENDDDEKFLDHHTWVQLDESIPSLKKFRKLAELLDMSLKSITAAWESGELANCGFTSSEMRNFIKAIFADSPLRKECLGWIVATPA
ncbi:centromere/kinetochore protein zw10 homolog isoform X1 [Aegilops tauschii subsp. strangulata]|uniref:centromere/kinetochore protein zw10 homolog isoform X1 n=1 Tax=Aegilops tauschii subsp. strangulata TaxID=200361 RepID=UPI001ABC52E3|nr:centromere/kinetochore protein zw10 homolog isoform X1 [Aegilops tauschii subsp. strangulata]XP_044438472.1 centromere/kinetochore protein zw10 homolog isoform X1 [Triticum aestivum]